MTAAKMLRVHSLLRTKVQLQTFLDVEFLLLMMSAQQEQRSMHVLLHYFMLVRPRYGD